MRSANDFRYDKALGGGALLDCGGYTLKLANFLLGDTAKIVCSNLVNENFDVDLYGSATIQNDDGLVAQISFGMDNAYKCELEVLGSKAILKAPRVFTAPDNFEVILECIDNNGVEKISVGTDDQFYNSINQFDICINNVDVLYTNYNKILLQNKLVDTL